MTTQTPAPPQWAQAPPTPPPPSRKPKWYARPLFWIVAMIGLFGLLLVATVIAGPAENATRPTATRPAPAAEPAPAVSDAPATTEAPVVEPTYATPKRGDFTLSIKTLSKENFGSAGALITYRIQAAWNQTYDPDKTYEVTYEVRGGEDGPAVNTLTVTGDEYERDMTEIASTSSSSRQLSVQVLSVEQA